MDNGGIPAIYDESKKDIKEEKKVGQKAGKKKGKGKYGYKLVERALNQESIRLNSIFYLEHRIKCFT